MRDRRSRNDVSLGRFLVQSGHHVPPRFLVVRLYFGWCVPGLVLAAHHPAHATLATHHLHHLCHAEHRIAVSHPPRHFHHVVHCLGSFRRPHELLHRVLAFLRNASALHHVHTRGLSIFLCVDAPRLSRLVRLLCHHRWAKGESRQT